MILCLLILAIILGCIFFVDRTEKFSEYGGPYESQGPAFTVDALVTRDLPTSPEVEFIQGEPDTHVVNRVDGTEAIRNGDIATSPGFGIGEGLVGFGRYGSSWIM
jgi:hypothetical protein